MIRVIISSRYLTAPACMWAKIRDNREEIIDNSYPIKSGALLFYYVFYLKLSISLDLRFMA